MATPPMKMVPPLKGSVAKGITKEEKFVVLKEKVRVMSSFLPEEIKEKVRREKMLIFGLTMEEVRKVVDDYEANTWKPMNENAKLFILKCHADEKEIATKAKAKAKGINSKGSSTEQHEEGKPDAIALETTRDEKYAILKEMEEAKWGKEKTEESEPKDLTTAASSSTMQENKAEIIDVEEKTKKKKKKKQKRNKKRTRKNLDSLKEKRKGRKNRMKEQASQSTKQARLGTRGDTVSMSPPGSSDDESENEESSQEK
jgi:hypothetical protein